MYYEGESGQLPDEPKGQYGGGMDLPSGIATTCSVALSLFDENLSTAARIKQLSEDPSFAKLARDWDAKGKVGFAAALLMESPPMKKLLEDFDTFLEVARIFITESITPPNPLVDAALVLIKQVAPEQGELHAGWMAPISRNAFSHEDDLMPLNLEVAYISMEEAKFKVLHKEHFSNS